jgi:hypothetical protein
MRGAPARTRMAVACSSPTGGVGGLQSLGRRSGGRGACIAGFRAATFTGRCSLREASPPPRRSCRRGPRRARRGGRGSRADAIHPVGRHALSGSVPRGGRARSRSHLDADRIAELEAVFHARHNERYSISLPDRQVEVVYLRVRAIGATPKITLRTSDHGVERPSAYFGRAHGCVEVDVHYGGGGTVEQAIERMGRRWDRNQSKPHGSFPI